VFVHPVIRRLPPRQMIVFEQGLLRTLGRASPILMPVTGVLLVLLAALGDGQGIAVWLRWAAVALWAAATVTTLVVNVPINVATGRWDPERPPDGWREVRRRWDVFQAVRAWLLLTAFVLLSLTLVVD
jgi:uncharacterized membrane protein